MAESSVGKRIFLSYAREDAYCAERLYRDLLAYGLNVWWDRRALLPGQDWDREIRRAIEASEWFIALISSRSVNKRGVVQREIRQAIAALKDLPEGSGFLIPARLDDCKPTHDRLLQSHWVDLFPNWEDGLSQLLLTFGIDRGSLGDANARLLQVMGLFRHSMIGPAQGLASAARLLGEIASAAMPENRQIPLLRNRIESESQVIRLWRQNYEFIDQRKMNLRLKEESVERLVREVIDEYSSALQGKAISLHYDAAISSKVTAWLDAPALSVAIANLLDNAVRYSYHGTMISVRPSMAGPKIIISIRDVGHDVPEFVKRTLDEPLQLPNTDLSSWILERRGFGLEIARAIVAAHGGILRYSSLAMPGENDDKVEKSFLVSFELIIPALEDGEK